jgi:hypothetical protein
VEHKALEALVERLKEQLAHSQALAAAAQDGSMSQSTEANLAKQQLATAREESARKGRLLLAAKQRAEAAEGAAAQAAVALEAAEEKQKRLSAELVRRRTQAEDLTKRLAEAELKGDQRLGSGGATLGSDSDADRAREDAAAARDARLRQQVSASRALCTPVPVAW